MPGKIVIAPLLLTAVMAILPGCAGQPGRTPGQQSAPGDDQAMYNNQPHHEESGFIPGPEITPPGALRAWLDALEGGVRGPRPLIRLPVVIEFSSTHRLSIARAWIGGPGIKPGPDTLRLRLDDGGMGISLVETARGRCRDDALSCALWLEGHWGALVGPVSPSESGEEVPTFAVLGVPGSVGNDGSVRPLRAWIRSGR